VLSKIILLYEELEKIHVSPAGSLLSMIVTYALSVVEEAIPSTYREAEISSSSRCERMP